jgi:hypothetical protein
MQKPSWLIAFSSKAEFNWRRKWIYVAGKYRKRRTHAWYVTAARRLRHGNSNVASVNSQMGRTSGVRPMRSCKRVIKLNSVAWVRERTPLVGEVSANFFGYTVPRGQRDESPWPYFKISRPDPLLFFFSSSSSVVLTRLSGPHSRLTVTQKIW